MIYLKRKAISVGGENSRVSVDNSDLKMATNIPVEMGGSKSGGTNPEELFLAGSIGCLTRSFEFLARKKQINYDSILVGGEVFLEDDTVNGGFSFRLSICFEIVGIDDAIKYSMVKETIEFCPFSKAIKNNINISYEIK
jgi:Ohr subfamily peroxiredoxin